MADEGIIEILKQALAGEVGTTIGRINLIFGVLAVLMVFCLYAGSAIEAIGDVLLRLFNRQGRPKSDSDKFLAFISVLIFFVISLIGVALYQKYQSPTSPQRIEGRVAAPGPHTDLILQPAI